MSSSQTPLNADVFLQDPVMLYRLTRSKYANPSGVGAAKYPGRWNQLGEEAIYTSCESSCTVLELLAHTRKKDMIPSDRALMRISLSGKWAPDRNRLRDIVTDGLFVWQTTLAEAYQYFESGSFQADRPFAVALPSVVAPSWNVVLYPAHRGFWQHVAIESVEPFTFDPRLFAEEARLEE